MAQDHLWCVWPAAGAVPAWHLLDELQDKAPSATHYLVIVPTQRALLFQVPLPPGPRRKWLPALPFLLEEHLLEPVERYEVWPLDDAPAPAGMLWLAVLERDWLSDVRAALSRIKQGELRWVLAGWGWPTESAWQLRLEAEKRAPHDSIPLLEVLLNRRGVDPLLLPLMPESADGSLSVAAQLSALLDMALTGVSVPTLLHYDVSAYPAAAAPLEEFCKTHQITAQAVQLPAAWQADFAQCSYSLLRQTSSVWRREWVLLFSRATWPRWRAALWVAAACLVLELMGLLAQWGTLTLEQRDLRQRAVEEYRALAGTQAAVVNPLLQMRRAYRTRRHAEGKTSEDDFLPLLTQASILLPTSLQTMSELSYEGGRLRVVLPAQSAEALPRLVSDFKAAGYSLSASATPDRSRWILLLSR